MLVGKASAGLNMASHLFEDVSMKGWGKKLESEQVSIFTVMSSLLATIMKQIVHMLSILFILLLCN